MAMLPLYQGVTAPNRIENKALYFDKFYGWNGYGVEREGKEKEKNSFMNKLEGSCGDKHAIEAFAKRHFELISAQKGKAQVYTNEWHFATGMGIEHPLENGMAWHHTLGVPYIAGSGVKGMVRAYCEIWQGWEPEKVARVFGSSAGEGSSGSYIFFDAVPLNTVALTRDVMTPHMGDWYERGGEEKHDHANIPADWHAPVPVTFLAVKSCTLLFGIAPRTKEPDTKELDELMEMLSEALEWVGAGTKTAVGYGRFVFSEPDTLSLETKLQAKKDKALKMQEEKEAQEQEAQALAKLSPLEQKIRKIGDIPSLVNALEQGVFDTEAKEAAILIKTQMQERNIWKPQGNPKKDKNINRTLKVMEYL